MFLQSPLQSEFILDGNVTVLVIKRLPGTLYRYRHPFFEPFLVGAFVGHSHRLLQMNGKGVRIVIHIDIITEAAAHLQHRTFQLDGIRKARLIRLERMSVSVRMKNLSIRTRTGKRPVGIGISHHELHAPSARADHSEQCLRIFHYFLFQGQSLFYALQSIDLQQNPAIILLQLAFSKSSGKEQLR